MADGDRICGVRPRAFCSERLLMATLLVTRWCWWIATGLFLGAALCGVTDQNMAMVAGGAVGTWWFSTLNLLPDKIFLKRMRHAAQHRPGHLHPGPGGRTADTQPWDHLDRSGRHPGRSPDAGTGLTGATRLEIYRAW